VNSISRKQVRFQLKPEVISSWYPRFLIVFRQKTTKTQLFAVYLFANFGLVGKHSRQRRFQFAISKLETEFLEFSGRDALAGEQHLFGSLFAED
jgi:hypothetical protein